MSRSPLLVKQNHSLGSLFTPRLIKSKRKVLPHSEASQTFGTVVCPKNKQQLFFKHF